jgi:plasmid rolling circle replication initiator protein Rep
MKLGELIDQLNEEKKDLSFNHYSDVLDWISSRGLNYELDYVHFDEVYGKEFHVFYVFLDKIYLDEFKENQRIYFKNSLNKKSSYSSYVIDLWKDSIRLDSKVMSCGRHVYSDKVCQLGITEDASIIMFI